VQSATALPTSILQVRIDSTNNRHKLIAAQNSLLDAHLKYLRSVNTFNDVSGRSPVTSAVIPTPGGLPFDPTGNIRGLPATDVQSVPADNGAVANSQCLVDCGKDPASAPFCPQFCQCKTTQCPASGDQAACNQYCTGLLRRAN
jgi:hypothetical protein